MPRISAQRHPVAKVGDAPEPGAVERHNHLPARRFKLQRQRRRGFQEPSAEGQETETHAERREQDARLEGGPDVGDARGAEDVRADEAADARQAEVDAAVEALAKQFPGH